MTIIIYVSKMNVQQFQCRQNTYKSRIKCTFMWPIRPHNNLSQWWGKTTVDQHLNMLHFLTAHGRIIPSRKCVPGSVLVTAPDRSAHVTSSFSKENIKIYHAYFRVKLLCGLIALVLKWELHILDLGMYQLALLASDTNTWLANRLSSNSIASTTCHELT